MERRNYAARAACAKTVLELLTSHVNGLDLRELPAPVPTVIAGRVLKRLAIKGLVKVAEEQWKPSPALFLAARVELQRE